MSESTKEFKNEKWLSVVEFPEYEVSNHGRIRNAETGHVLHPVLDSSGYAMVKLFQEKKPYSRRIHRLVLEAFVGPCPESFEADHRNGNKLDNRTVNLRWVTRSENQISAVAMGLKPPPTRKLADGDYQKIHDMLKVGLTHERIGAAFGVSRNYVTMIANGHRGIVEGLACAA